MSISGRLCNGRTSSRLRVFFGLLQAESVAVDAQLFHRPLPGLRVLGSLSLALARRAWDAQPLGNILYFTICVLSD